MATYSKKRDELVLGVSEADIRLVDAFYHELARSNDHEDAWPFDRVDRAIVRS